MIIIFVALIKEDMYRFAREWLLYYALKSLSMLSYRRSFISGRQKEWLIVLDWQSLSEYEVTDSYQVLVFGISCLQSIVIIHPFTTEVQ